MRPSRSRNTKLVSRASSPTFDMGDMAMPKRPQRPEVRVKPHVYQPRKAELEEPVKIDATPDDLARAVLQPVKIVEDDDA